MNKYGIMLACFLGLGLLSQGLTKPVTPAPENKEKSKDDTSKRIEQLVKQLGAKGFADREDAQKELETIGAPAIELLRKTLKDPDPEVSKRAGDVVRKFEEKALTASVLAPKKVNLSLKNVSVADAVAQLAKQSGYSVTIEEKDKAVLSNRKITLETGEVTFFEALDQLCAKGGMVERSQNGTTTVVNPNPPIIRPRPPVIKPVPLPNQPNQPAQPNQVQPGAAPVPKVAPPVPPQGGAQFNPQGGIQMFPQGGIQIAPQGGIQFVPQGNIQIAPIQIAPIVFPPQNEIDTKMQKMIDDQMRLFEAQLQALQQIQQQGVFGQGGVGGQGGAAGGQGGAAGGQGGIGGGQGGANGGQGGAAGGQGGAPGAQGAVQILPAIQQVQPGMRNPPIVRPGLNQNNPQQIILADGKPLDVPTSYAGAARIRLLPPASVNMSAMPGEILLVFEVTAEPRLQVFRPQGTPTFTVAKDDQGQNLNVIEQANINMPGVPQIQIQPFPNPNPAIQPANPMFQPFNPSFGQRIIPVRVKLGDKKAQALKELKGTIPVEVSLPSQPVMTIANVLQAKGQSVNGKNGETMTLDNIEKVNNGYKVQFSITSNLQVNGGGAAIGRINFNTQATPDLVDADGKNYKITGNGTSRSKVVNGVMTRTLEITYSANAGQGDPASLVVSEPSFTTVAVPFEFKNVQLP